MRPLEILFCLSFLPVLLMVFIPFSRRKNLICIAALLPILAALFHVVLEGWRAQLIPLYVLALVIAICQALVILMRITTIRRRYQLLAGTGTTLLVIFGAVFAGLLLPVITLPKPTGPYQVGIVDREVIDTTRGRRLMVSIWYPAATDGPPAPLTHHPDEIMKGLGDLTGLPPLLFQHLRYMSLSASEGVPVQTSSTPFPVLVFSHGMVGLRLQNSSTLQDLASWGYIVVAIDHTDAAAVTVFPDGEARYYNLERFGVPANAEPDGSSMNTYVFPVWVADQRFIYDTLETWEKNDPLLAGKLDLAHIGSFGHSFGGATALEVCLVDARCQAAVDLDGGLYGEAATQPSVRPLLLMTSADSSQYPTAIKKWQHLLAYARADAYWLELPHSSHLSFTFSQLLSPLLVPQAYEPRRGLQIIDKYLLAFFDATLRHTPTPLLKPEAESTEVIWHTK